MASTLDTIREQKRRLRERAHAHRNAQLDKDDISQRIWERFIASPEYATAQTVLLYVDVRSEVRTRPFLPAALGHGKTIAVPYCVNAELELFHLESIEELELGAYKILEPKSALRDLPAKRIDPSALDLVVVPGVAFDRRGARMGHGFGYYDKLLRHCRSDAVFVAFAFECQLFPEIPNQAHDIFMNKVITELGIYPGERRHDTMS